MGISELLVIIRPPVITNRPECVLLSVYRVLTKGSDPRIYCMITVRTENKESTQKNWLISNLDGLATIYTMRSHAWFALRFSDARLLVCWENLFVFKSFMKSGWFKTWLWLGIRDRIQREVNTNLTVLSTLQSNNNYRTSRKNSGEKLPKMWANTKVDLIY